MQFAHPSLASWSRRHAWVSEHEQTHQLFAWMRQIRLAIGMVRALGSSLQRGTAYSGQAASAGWHCPAAKVQPQPMLPRRPQALPRLTPPRCTQPLTAADAACRGQGRLLQHSSSVLHCRRHDRRAGLCRGTSRDCRLAWRRSAAAGRELAVRRPHQTAPQPLRSGRRQPSSTRTTFADG